MAQHQVDAPGERPERVGEVGDVALHGAHAVADAGLLGPPGQRGERVGARVDDDDAVTGLGQRHGEAAGAAAGVDQVEAAPVAVGLGERARQDLPHDGRAGGGGGSGAAAGRGGRSRVPARAGVHRGVVHGPPAVGAAGGGALGSRA